MLHEEIVGLTPNATRHNDYTSVVMGVRRRANLWTLDCGKICREPKHRQVRLPRLTYAMIG
jgi:hypothetical protein